jgi:allantoinase
MNIEHFRLDLPATSTTPVTVGLVPDALNYGWRDYGVRVGIWRMMEVMQRHGVRGTVALNSDVCSEYPRIIEEGKRLGWEWMGHGITNSIRIGDQSEAEQRELVKESVTVITKSVGKKPRGWLSPGLTETVNTLDYLDAVFVGAERYSGAAEPASEPRAVRADDLRPVRRPLRGRRQDRAGDVDLPAPVPDRAPAPQQVFR